MPPSTTVVMMSAGNNTYREFTVKRSNVNVTKQYKIRQEMCHNFETDDLTNIKIGVNKDQVDYHER